MTESFITPCFYFKRVSLLKEEITGQCWARYWGNKLNSIVALGNCSSLFWHFLLAFFRFLFHSVTIFGYPWLAVASSRWLRQSDPRTMIHPSYRCRIFRIDWSSTRLFQRAGKQTHGIRIWACRLCQRPRVYTERFRSCCKHSSLARFQMVAARRANQHGPHRRR